MTDGKNGFWDTEEDLEQSAAGQNSTVAPCSVQPDYESKLRALLGGLEAQHVDDLMQKDNEYFFVLGGVFAKAVKRGLDT